jgi:hypothetical protein
MNVEDILEVWLTEHGYDGLCNPEEECGCKIGDLITCHSYCGYCKPGYLHVDWGIYSQKETKRVSFKENIHKLQIKNLEKKRKQKLVVPTPPPRYDKVYFEGLEWLDSLVEKAR